MAFLQWLVYYFSLKPFQFTDGHIYKLPFLQLEIAVVIELTVLSILFTLKR